VADAPEPLSREDQSVVIVGAGLAGVRAAEGLRQAGFAGRVVLLGEEVHEPYDRPPLSKAVLKAGGDAAGLALSPAGAMAALGVETRLGARAVSIDRAARTVELAGGERLGYDRLVLATGSRPRVLVALPRDAPGVFYLRTLDDALALRGRLAPGARLAIVGGGVIGLEAAASARALGCEVTLVEAEGRIMARSASPAVASFLEARHRAEGVEIRLSTRVATDEPSAAWRLGLSDGTTVEARAVLVGVGVVPNLELARDSGLEIAPEGIVVDAFGATSDPRIFAAGEVAFHVNALSGARERQETWAHASAHGEHVGLALVGAQAPYAQTPSYWTDQYDIAIQVAGAPMGETDVVRGDVAAGRFLVFHLAQGRIAGVTSVNAARELRAAKRLIGSRPSNPAALADTGQTLAAVA
jgi:NADPH-dependent 2,4-dienoyl-CoA reductase/sulfur reductase-like enzyme